MNYKYIALGGLIGFLFAVAPSCGSSKDCSAANCAGCCDSNKTCQTQSAATCGASGAACIACATGQQCSGGVCTGGSAGGGGGQSCHDQGKCTKQNGECGQPCSVGCCVPNDPFGTCSAAVNNQLCGKNGDTCAACTAGVTCAAVTGGGQCGGNTTGDAGTPVAGKPCTSASDCVGLPNAICKTTTSGGAPYPGGFCTADCQADTDCGPNAFCVGGVDQLGETPANQCWPKCNDASECRTPGYNCYTVSQDPNDPGACYLDPLPEVDGGRPAPDGVPGKACSLDTDCGPPPDRQPTCFAEVTDAGQLTGYPGGYCTSLCDVQANTICGPTGSCITFSVSQTQTVSLCQQKCSDAFEGGPGTSGCRSGYYCRGFNADGGNTGPVGGAFNPDGYCKRRCDNQVTGADGGVTTIGCGTGQTCNANGVCCTSTGQCG